MARRVRVYRNKRTGTWYATGKDPDGRQWWKSTGVSLDKPRRAAEVRGLAIERERLLRLQVAPAPELALRDALEELRAHKARLGRAAATFDVLRTKGRNLARVLGPDRDLAALELADVEAYLDTRRAEGVTDQTIAKELGVLREALNRARRLGRYARDPRELWPDALENVYTPRERWLTVEEYRALVEAAYEGRREHLAAYVYLGVRYSELFRLEARHVDPGERRVFVDGTKGNARYSKRWVPIAAALWPVLEARVAATPEGPLFEFWLRQNMRQSLARWSKRAGIEPVTANDLRRTFASWLASAGVPELTTARLMGHATSTMVRRVYAQISGDATREAIDRLPR